MSKENELSDEQMPVVAWYGSNASHFNVVALKQNHVLREFDPGEIVPEALVRQSDAQAALVAQAVKIERLYAARASAHTSQPVALSAVERKPLTPAQRAAILKSVEYKGRDVWEVDWGDVIDAVEKQHGITAQQGGGT